MEHALHTESNNLKMELIHIKENMSSAHARELGDLKEAQVKKFNIKNYNIYIYKLIFLL